MIAHVDTSRLATILAMQLNPTGLDPTPWTAWGVLGLLGLVVVVLMGVIWKLFLKQTSTMEARDQILMNFVDKHRGETTQAMKEVATTVSLSHQKMVEAFGRQARALDEVLLTNRVLDKVETMRARGTQLTAEEIERVVRTVIHERSQQRANDTLS